MRVASVFLVGATALGASAAPGRVVRIERARVALRAVPVLCNINTDASGLCFGPAPKIGDTIAVISDAKVIADLRVKRVSHDPKLPVTCETMWQFTSDVVRGDISRLSRAHSVGVIDGNLDEHKATMIDDDTLAPLPDGGRGLLGIDRDGDGNADIVVAQADCDPAGHTPRIECVGIWNRDHDGQLRRATTFNLTSCFPSAAPPPPTP